MPEERLNRPKRQLSRFMCEELLYEYAKEKLDKDRKHAVEAGLNSHDDLRRDLDSIRLAMSYCDQISSSRISMLQMERLRATSSPIADSIEQLRYRNWPDVVQWTAQALILSSLVAVFALTLPWQKIERRTAYLVQISHPSLLSPRNYQDVTRPVSPPSVPPLTNQKATAAKGTRGPTPSAPIKVASNAINANAPKPSTEAQTSSSSFAATLPSNVEFIDETTGAPANLKGLLYRMLMALPDVDSVAPEVREKILALGGYKAGQVELGWRKVNPSGAYFHFIIPEKNFNALIKTLGGYGPVRILKTAHQRVMPQGKIRIILWMKEQSPEPQSNDQNNNTDQ